MIMLEVINRDGSSYPLMTRLTLRCDTPGCPTSHSFEHPDGYVGQYRLAMKAGWKDTHRNGERVFFGPCCSGKVRDG